MTARLYWYPESGAWLRELDLGRYWSELLASDGADSAVARTAGGERVMTTFSSARGLRAQLEYLEALTTAGALVIDELHAVINHLRRNGCVALAEDDGRTWAGYARVLLERGRTEIPIEDNLWSQWDTPDLAAGDRVVIRGGGLEGKWETGIVQSITSSKRKIVLSSGLRYDYSDDPWVLVRDARFWPFLRLTDRALGEAPLSTDRCVTYDLDLALEEDVGQMASAASGGGLLRGTILPGWEYTQQLDGVDLDGRPVEELGSGVKL